jgi:hypothetical protein
MTENSKKGISRKGAILMGIGFAVAAILVGAASLISGLSIVEISLMVGWVVLMSIFAWVGYSVSNIKLAYILRGIAAVSLGGALSIGGGTMYTFVTIGSVPLTICNYCSDTFIYEPLGIEVGSDECQTISVPPVTAVIWQEGDRIFVRALGQEDSFPKDAEVVLDSHVIEGEDPVTVNLAEKGKHTLVVRCKS